MHRQDVSRLMAEGEALLRAGRHAEAEKVATALLRAICAARSMRRDNNGAGIRGSDVEAITWAQSVIEKIDVPLPGEVGKAAELPG
jgi:hypothetical protein